MAEMGSLFISWTTDPRPDAGPTFRVDLCYECLNDLDRCVQDIGAIEDAKAERGVDSLTPLRVLEFRPPAVRRP